MKVRYSLRTLLAISAIATIVLGLHLNLRHEIESFRSDVRDLRSGINETVPDYWKDSGVRITKFQIERGLFDILCFRCQIDCQFLIEKTIDAETRYLPPDNFFHSGTEEPDYSHRLVADISLWGYETTWRRGAGFER